MIKRNELVKYLNQLLSIYDFQDYGPNGLQIEGKEEISKIAFAVSATRDSVNEAVRLGADCLIVHHGLFWKFHGVRTITKTFAKRVKPLIQNDINLLGYHLPLDAHLEFGNAAAIAKRLGLKELTPFGDHKGSPTGVRAKFETKISASELQTRLQDILNHDVICATYDENKMIGSIGIITGGANSDWIHAQRDGLDAYLTGEISEHDWHEAREGDVVYYAGGHNATEQFGVQDLTKHLFEKFKDRDLDFFYIPSSNPA